MKRIVFVLYTLLACTLTYPLIFKLNSSVYGFYDHITTDMFGIIQTNFWWVINHSNNLFINNLSTFPFGSRMFFTNMTGFVMTPVSLLFGYLVSYNIVVLINLILSAFGMFLLVKHITSNKYAGFIAGIIFGFCPNMLVRSYTTFDSTQIQWIPFYTLYLIKFFETGNWKNIILSGIFFTCIFLFSMPYYLVYMPIHTVILTIIYFKKEVLYEWKKVVLVLSIVIIGFFGYYTTFVGGSTFVNTVQRTTTELKELSLLPLDYLVPHPRSTFLKGNFKSTYWDAQDRAEKNSDSDVAYVGYVALLLAIVGLYRGRGKSKWFFLVSSIVAFWSTLTPYSPSGFIHLYALFARRILIYKVFVQFGIAGLAGIGTTVILDKIKSYNKRVLFVSGTILLILFEYIIVPPSLSVNLTEVPEIYKQVKALSDSCVVIEVPLCRYNGNAYQGYQYYQMYHNKPLFNTYADFGLNLVPDNMKSFYNKMRVPQEVGQYSNLVKLHKLGITHLIYHYYIGTKTVRFLAPPALIFEQEDIPGLRCIYRGAREFKTFYISPYDYSFADLYEITAR